MITKRRNRFFFVGSLELLCSYILINFSLFAELILGEGDYVSHREEMSITGNSDFWGCVKGLFLESAQHAPSLHKGLILPILAIILLYAFRWKKWKKDGDGEDVEIAEKAFKCREMYILLLIIFLVNILVALFYGFCQSGLVVDFRNSVSGFFHYFSPYRVYWLYPTTWYLAAGLAAGLLWKDHEILPGDTFTLLLIGMVCLPTVWNIYQNSNWILNRSQYNNDCNIGLMSWSDYFAEELMADIKTAIEEDAGLEQPKYRVASLGICPAVALEAGFYCIDGYSNNYSLEYKHEFREVIEKELEKTPSMQAYFDNWGSRCYLFTEESQNYYYLAKDADFRYEKLELNTEKMKELGCRYLFSGAEIEQGNVEELGLELFGVFETEESYYRIWVYEIE